jgi:hypothetical protein
MMALLSTGQSWSANALLDSVTPKAGSPIQTFYREYMQIRVQFRLCRARREEEDKPELMPWLHSLSGFGDGMQAASA